MIAKGYADVKRLADAVGLRAPRVLCLLEDADVRGAAVTARTRGDVITLTVLAPKRFEAKRFVAFSLYDDESMAPAGFHGALTPRGYRWAIAFAPVHASRVARKRSAR